MVKNRQIRLVGVALFSLLVVFALYRSKVSYHYNIHADKSDGKVSAKAHDLIDTSNNDKTDVAINNAILKLNNQDNLKDDKKAADALTAAETPEDGIPFDPVKELLQIRSLAPMTIFSKTYCTYSKKLKKLLSDNYQITPQPTFVEIDKHSHGVKLQQYLGELTGRSTVPNVLIGISNISKGGFDDFFELHQSGELLTLLQKWGGKSLLVKKINTPSNV